MQSFAVHESGASFLGTSPRPYLFPGGGVYPSNVIHAGEAFRWVKLRSAAQKAVGGILVAIFLCTLPPKRTPVARRDERASSLSGLRLPYGGAFCGEQQ